MLPADGVLRVRARRRIVAALRIATANSASEIESVADDYYGFGRRNHSLGHCVDRNGNLNYSLSVSFF